jgi:hypothetical protein
LTIALSAAFVLHAAIALVGYRVARDVAPAAFEAVPAQETEIEIVDAFPSLRGNLDDAIDEVFAGATSSSSPERSRNRREGAAAIGSVDPPNGAQSAEGASAEGTYALDPSAGVAAGTPSEGTPIQLGIGAGDWSRWVDPSAPPGRQGSERAELRPAPVSSTGGLAEALEARDQALGLGPAGAVLTAVHEAGYSDVAPALGTATFSITVLRSGAIDVQLTGASSQAAAWTKVGDSIAAAIRRKPPRIAPTRIGVRLGIEVVAEERWPNGQPTRSDSGPKLAVVGPKFQATEAAKEALLDRNPAAVPEPDAPAGRPPLQANFEAPGVFIQVRGKVCSYKIGISQVPISGGCDPANIGQPARRVVSTRVMSQTML